MLNSLDGTHSVLASWRIRGRNSTDADEPMSTQMRRTTGTRDVQECTDDEQSVLLQQWLKLLRHLGYRSASSKAALAHTDLLPALQKSWKTVSLVPACVHEALLLISVLVSDSFDARHAVSTTGDPSILVILVRDFLRCVLCCLDQCLTVLSERPPCTVKDVFLVIE